MLLLKENLRNLKKKFEATLEAINAFRIKKWMFF
jgi:hypothetical protein